MNYQHEWMKRASTQLHCKHQEEKQLIQRASKTCTANASSPTNKAERALSEGPMGYARKRKTLMAKLIGCTFFEQSLEKQTEKAGTESENVQNSQELEQSSYDDFLLSAFTNGLCLKVQCNSFVISLPPIDLTFCTHLKPELQCHKSSKSFCVSTILFLRFIYRKPIWLLGGWPL